VVTYGNLFLPSVAVLVDILVQVTSYRYDRRKRLGRSILLGLFTGFIALVVMELGYWPKEFDAIEKLCVTFVDVVIYIGFAYCYFGIIGLGISLRIRIINITLNHEGGIDYEGLANEFNARMLFEKRLERLLKSGKIRIANDFYSIGSKLILFMCRTSIMIKKCLTAKGSEFD